MNDDIILDRISIHEVDFQLGTELVLKGHDHREERHVGRITWEEVGDKLITVPTWLMPNRRPETAQALQRLADKLWLGGNTDQMPLVALRGNWRPLRPIYGTCSAWYSTLQGEIEDEQPPSNLAGRC